MKQLVISALFCWFGTFSWGATIGADQSGEIVGRIVRPRHYVNDPGAGFPVVFLKDASAPTSEIVAFANAFKDAVFVCAQGADRAGLLAELEKDRRLFAFPRGRIELASADLKAADATSKLRTYFKWGRYQAETPKLTRYGARVYRRERGGSVAPTISVPEPWRVLEGDEGETGCDARLAYFTVEADGEGLPAPVVTVSWPNVGISSIGDGTNVAMVADGVAFTPMAESGGTNYLTMVEEGAIELALHHHVEGAQHGPYAGRPLPWMQIRASDNWRAACLTAFRAAGLSDPAGTGGASIKLYGFDSNFPRRHVDYPEHFHVMLEWDNWAKNNVGHYTLDGKGFIRGNNFLVCGDIEGGLAGGYHQQQLGETTEYVGPLGKALFSLEMLGGGVGFVLRKPDSDEAWRICSDQPTESIKVSWRKDASADWVEIDRVSVVDDTEAGLYTIHHTRKGTQMDEEFRYDRDSGGLMR